MSQNHVTEMLSDYCLGALKPDESQVVAEHVLACPDCRQVYEEVKLGVSFASQLSPVKAPPDLWPEIVAGLDAASDKRSSFIAWRGLLAAAAALVLLTIGLLWYKARDMDRKDVVVNYPTPPVTAPSVSGSPKIDTTSVSTAPLPLPGKTHVPARGGSLEVTSISGSPLVAAEIIEGKGQLGVGQWLETDARSRARIQIADIGKVDVEENSRISLIATRPSEHRLNLARGRVHALISAPPRLFIVETPAATAIDLGCEYTLEVDESGGGTLRVTGGFVALERQRREAIVPAGAICLIRPGAGPGTPFFEDASELFRKSVDDFDLGRNRSQALQTMLTEARRRDTLTLWNLLPLVSRTERERVFDRMVELFPPPDEVSRSGIVGLNRAMLEFYRKRLEWVW